ncbi:MAG: hypothetical protein OEN55_16120 [Alphaproteobacteria bacterium]|nr:hypothetical protein [Alphaproteobacteria bacterium]
MNIELITSVDRLEGTLYFEFHPGAYGGNHWRTESVYLHLYVFDLVANVFVAEIPEFSYFGPTTISGRRVEKLAKALDEFAAAVNSAETPDAVWQPIEGTFIEDLSDQLDDWTMAKGQVSISCATSADGCAALQPEASRSAYWGYSGPRRSRAAMCSSCGAETVCGAPSPCPLPRGERVLPCRPDGNSPLPWRERVG